MQWTIALEGGPKKVNHAAVTVNDKIFTFGGYCTGENYTEICDIDVYILNTDCLRWKICDFKHSSEIPFQRYGHTVVVYEDKVYLWGGRNDNIACNKLFCFDTSTFVWSSPDVTGIVPDARDGHSACIIDHHMYIFAGYLETTDSYTQEIHALNLKTFTWKYINAQGCKPIYRDFHSATPLNGMMYVWGGREVVNGWYEGIRNEEYGSEMHLFDPEVNEWRIVATEGDIPVGRRSHSALTYNNKLYIFGGFNSRESQHYNDLHVFDPETNIWSKIVATGKAPCPRRRQAFCLSGTKIFLFGGTSPSRRVDGISYEEFDVEANFIRDDGLIEHSDLYVLDIAPTLKTLCAVKVLQLKLDTSWLPVDIKILLKIMTTPNSICRTDNQTG